MHEFTVWAPKAKKIAVKIGEAVYPMQSAPMQNAPMQTADEQAADEQTADEQTADEQAADHRGWWRVAVEDAGPGTDYAFLLDDDPTPYPDPRSEWQPNGVDGASRVVDHQAFHWNDAAWQAIPIPIPIPIPLSGAVIYELHPGTFTRAGTFDAAIERLPYLADLGVTHIELMPVAAFAGDFGWGYDGVALFAVHAPYGGPDGLKRLIDSCHLHGITVIVDVVYNHFGPVGNHTGKFGPYVTADHHTPWGGAVNLEGAGSDQVRRFFLDNARMWLRDYHADGLRLDATHAFVDRSALHFLEQLAAEVEALSTLGRRLVLIAESDLNDPRVVTPLEAHGYGMDAQTNDDFHHALFTVLHDEPSQGYYDDFGSMAHLAKSLTRAFVYDGIYSSYRRRTHGRPVDGLSAHRFIGFIQNHDQVGNRATGDRVEQIVGLDRAKLAAALVFTAPFIPMIFQGEEFAASTPFQYFANHQDPELARAVSEGRKREFAAFGWSPDQIPDPEKRETFERSKLNWDELLCGAHAEMLAWYKQLLQLRRSSPSLNDGDMGHVRVAFDETLRWLRMERGLVTVLCNLGDDAVELDNPAGFPLLLASRADVRAGERKISLPPNTLAILSGESAESGEK
jgi:maltooligosyltrehalose trehalohydrolase